MKFELLKIEELCGKKATVYSIKLEGEEHTLFEKFLSENIDIYPDEVQNVLDRLMIMSRDTGVIDIFLKKPEGNWGQDVWALYDVPGTKLRVYFIKLGKFALILGGGGPKTTRTLQEDPQLKKENYLLRTISKMVTDRIVSRDLTWKDIELVGAPDDFFFDEDDF